MIREHYNNRDEWLTARNKKMNGLGGSDVALVCGIKGAYGNIDDLYNKLKGISKPKAVSNTRIQDGVKAEPLIRQMFEITHSGIYKVEYNGFDILRSEERPYLFSTLDGELTDLRNGEKGIWECKKILCSKKSEYAEWDGRIPDKYLAQQVIQLYCTGWDFNILEAWIDRVDYKKVNGAFEDEPLRRTEIHYHVVRRDDETYEANLNWILNKTDKFWDDLLNDKRPALELKK